MSSSPRSATQINLMEDFDFTTLTGHELEILDNFTAGDSDSNLRLTELLNSITRVFQKIWRLLRRKLIVVMLDLQQPYQ